MDAGIYLFQGFFQSCGVAADLDGYSLNSARYVRSSPFTNNYYFFAPHT